jgi:PAS domain S-box-containing protein
MSEAHIPAAGQPIRVLLVEDNPGGALDIAALLQEASPNEFTIERVDRLAGALAVLDASGADVVLLDLDLPDSDGLETLTRTQREGRAEPIVVISGLRDERMALDAVRAGAQDYVVKGTIDGALLARVIRYAIERRRLELRMRWLTLAVEQSPASVFITNPQGVIEYVNARFTQVTGYTPDEAIGRTPRILKSGLTPPHYYEQLWRTILAGETWRAEVRNRRKNGDLYWDQVVISPIRDARGTIVNFLSLQEDITYRKEVEAALRASEAYHRTILENIGDAVFITDASGRYLDVNPRACELTGYTHEELVGLHVSDTYVPDERAEVAGRLARAQAGKVQFAERQLLRKDGSVVLVEVSARPLPDGRLLATLRDITERRTLEQQLRQAQKMEAVGRLAGGVAHDFNNLLTAIFGYAEFAAEDLPADSPVREDIEEIRKAAQRASSLTRQLLAFSRQQVLEPVVLNLNELVRDLEKMLRRLIGEDVEMDLRLSEGLANVRADPGQLNQVLLNLVVNARDAMPTGGRLLIETQDAELNEDYVEQHQPVVPGAYVLLAVSDTGSGMTPDVKSHLFEPFFTTKEKGKGTGLGLSTVYGIVKQSGGYIWAYSEVGVGTTFKIYLPRVDAPAQTAARRPEPGSLSGTETILVAEDDEPLRLLASAMLRKLGYTVLEAQDADMALAAAAAHPGAIHLLVTDVVMPGQSGRALARALIAARPTLKVLYISGYTDEAIVHHGMLEPGLHFLQKPFTSAGLAKKVRSVLDAS